MTIYFITPNWLKSSGVLNKNIDDLMYSNLIEPAAKAFLPRQLGKQFFNHLLARYNDQTLTGPEEDLVEIMQWAIAFRLKSELILESSLALTNKGLQTQSSDNSVGADLKSIGLRMDNCLQQATVRENELRDYLCENKDLFPEFIATSNKNSSIKAYCCSTFGGWCQSCGCKGGPDYNEQTGILII